MPSSFLGLNFALHVGVLYHCCRQTHSSSDGLPFRASAMSLLKVLRIPQLRSTSRAVLTARMSSLPGGDTFDDSLDSPDQPTFDYDDQPPVGPESAYPHRSRNPISHRFQPKPRETSRYSLYVHSDNNNNILTFTRPDGSPIMTVSGGQVGYKHKARGTPEAAHLCAIKIFKRIEQELEQQGTGRMVLEVLFNGFGKGRDAVNKALLAAESARVRDTVAYVTDITRIKIGGTRSKKARRL